ncbi:cytochrome-c peroxidase [Corticimicrobacter populi]|uniref:Cytochrome-c peroxidase n=1 Tax=Corticimicrobacter populi TaxID=2175229 RepID=A0A2V1K1M9_9BURK|nr:cytochrome c peroxidase [Corticimicrobacter populi]PWF21922.1 cytochrome-c peroxidase [Corticimicrobacter populi]
MRLTLRCLTALAGPLLIIGLYQDTPAQRHTGSSPTDADPATLRARYEKPATHWPPAWLDPGVPLRELAILPARARPTPYRQAQAALGERLFSDTVLAAPGYPSCAACHQPAQGWSAPPRRFEAPLGSTAGRKPPSLYHVARRTHWGWDGRRDSLVAQTLAPLTDPDEMGNTDLAVVLQRLARDPRHAQDFQSLYGPGPVTAAMLGDALVAYLAGIEKPSRLDRFLAGDHAQLSDQAILGLHLFRTKARCLNCHSGPLLTDEGFHNLRISAFGEPAEDLGRYRVSGQPEDAGAFRTASLRHVGEHPPYMHNGLFPTLAGVINLYDRGGGEVWARNAQEAAHPLYPHAARRSARLQPLHLDEAEKAALLAFLEAL